MSNLAHHDIASSPQYIRETYSYHVFNCVADVDECFDQLTIIARDKKPNKQSNQASHQRLHLALAQLIESCYQLVGASIGLSQQEASDVNYQQTIKRALVNYPTDIQLHLYELESTYEMSFLFENQFNKLLETLHKQVSNLQASLQDVYLMKLSPRH